MREICPVCQKEFEKRLKPTIYCSIKCFREWRNTLQAKAEIGRKISLAKKGVPVYARRRQVQCVCFTCQKIFYRRKGHMNRSKNVYCSALCVANFQSTLRREKAFNWKGGRNSLRQLLREMPENRQWIAQVLKNDNFVCQECGCTGGQLEAHHKIHFSALVNQFLKQYNQFSPLEDCEILVRIAINYELFWDVSNGKTLCKSCHRGAARLHVKKEL